MIICSVQYEPEPGEPLVRVGKIKKPEFTFRFTSVKAGA